MKVSANSLISGCLCVEFKLDELDHADQVRLFLDLAERIGVTEILSDDARLLVDNCIEEFVD